MPRGCLCTCAFGGARFRSSVPRFFCYQRSLANEGLLQNNSKVCGLLMPLHSVGRKLLGTGCSAAAVTMGLQPATIYSNNSLVQIHFQLQEAASLFAYATLDARNSSVLH